MGNEVNQNSNHKILTNQSSFNKSNLHEMQDSDSETKIKKENEKDKSSSSLVSIEGEYEADGEIEKSSEKLNNNINNGKVEYTFIWEEKCNLAKVIGSFNNWKDQLLMTYDPKDNLYKYKIELKRDKYEYKFIIDNAWKFSSHQQTKNDGKGNINNFIDLTNYKINTNNAQTTKKVKKIKKKKKKIKKIEKVESYGVLFPTKDELNTEAPITQELYLKSFYINEATNQDKIGNKLYLSDFNTESYTEEKSYRNLLFSPHVNLNHTMNFCDNKDILQVGLSYRFRNKDCTLVYYSRLNK
jgi:hypothetical protein